jgi:putative hydrolase of the HAD superfamily
MSRFTTVLWDVGGVLLTNGWDHNQRKAVLEKLQIADLDEFEARHAEQNDPWEKGTIDFDEYLRRTVFYREQPFSSATVKVAIEAESVMLADSAMPVLRELHAEGGLVMGQLNNESRELNDVRLERFGLHSLLSVFFCSGYVGLRKPDPAIYRLALEVLQQPAEQVVFVDDREKNAAVASSLGMHGIHYTGSAALRAELKQLGLL